MSQTLVPLPNPKSKSQEEPGPSHVVHFRNVREPIIQVFFFFLFLQHNYALFLKQDILVLCQGYGKVRNILMLASKNQAFVEFEDVRDATRLINNSNDSRLIIQFRYFYFCFYYFCFYYFYCCIKLLLLLELVFS